MHLTPILEQLIQEEVYGNNAIVYHRTDKEDIMEKVFETGWKPGSGRYYGTGFYSTFKLESQLRDNMAQTYGNYIGKFAVNTDRFLIFIYDVFLKSPIYNRIRIKNKKNEEDFRAEVTQKNFIRLQLEYFGYDVSEKVRYLDKAEENNYFDPDTWDAQSSLFYNLFSSDTGKIDSAMDQLNIRGFIYRGRRDGDVLISYDIKNITPLSVATVTTDKMLKLDTESLVEFANKQFKENSRLYTTSIKGQISGGVNTKISSVSDSRVDDDKQLIKIMYQLSRAFRLSTHKEVELTRTDKNQYDLYITSEDLRELSANDLYTTSLELQAEHPGIKIYLKSKHSIIRFEDVFYESGVSFSDLAIILSTASVTRLTFYNGSPPTFRGLPSVVEAFIATSTSGSRGEIQNFKDFSQNLKYLYIDGVDVKSFEGLPEGLSMLTVINSAVADLRHIPKSVVDVVFSYNNIQSLLPLKDHTNIQVFHVNNNPLETLEGFPVIADYRPVYLIDLPKLKNLTGIQVQVGSEKIIVKNCPEFKSSEGAPSSVKHLQIQDCIKFSSLKGIAQDIRYVTVENCPEFVLEDPGHNVSLLEIINCKGISRDTPKPNWVGVMIIDGVGQK